MSAALNVSVQGCYGYERNKNGVKRKNIEFINNKSPGIY